MKIIYLFLIIFTGGVISPAQVRPHAQKFAEFGSSTNGFVKMTMNALDLELAADPGADAIIINYGSDRDVAVREKQILGAIRFLKLAALRITLIRGGFWKSEYSEIYVVPSGAPKPEPAEKAVLFDEIGKVPDGQLKARIQYLFVRLDGMQNESAYFVVSAPEKLFRLQRSRILRILNVQKHDSSRIKFVRSGMAPEIITRIYVIAE